MPTYVVPTKLQDNQGNWVYLPGHFNYVPDPDTGQYPDITDALTYWLTRLEDANGRLTIKVPVDDTDPNWGLAPRCWNATPENPTIIRFRRFMADGVTPAVYCVEYGLSIGARVRLNGSQYPEAAFGMEDWDTETIFMPQHYWKNTIFDLNGARFVQYDPGNYTIDYQTFLADMVGCIKADIDKTSQWVTNPCRYTSLREPVTVDSSWVGVYLSETKGPQGSLLYPAGTYIAEVDTVGNRFRASAYPLSAAFATGQTTATDHTYAIAFKTYTNAYFYNPEAPDGTMPSEMEPVDLTIFDDAAISASIPGSTIKAQYGVNGNWVENLRANTKTAPSIVVKEDWLQLMVTSSKTVDGLQLYPSGTSIVEIDFAGNRFRTSNPPAAIATTGAVVISTGTLIGGGKKVLPGGVVLTYDGDETIGEANRYSIAQSQAKAVPANYARYQYKGKIKVSTQNLRKKNGMNMLTINGPVTRPKRVAVTWTAGSDRIVASSPVFSSADVGLLVGDEYGALWPDRTVVLECISPTIVRVSNTAIANRNTAVRLTFAKIRGALTTNVQVYGRMNPDIPRASFEMSNYALEDAVGADKEPWHQLAVRGCSNVTISDLLFRYTWSDVVNCNPVDSPHAAWVWNTEDVTITNCFATSAGRHFITAQGNVGLTITDSQFYNSRHWCIDTESFNLQAKMAFMTFQNVVFGGRRLGCMQIKPSPNGYLHMPIVVTASATAGSTTVHLDAPIGSRSLLAKVLHAAMPDWTCIRRIMDPLTVELNNPVSSSFTNEQIVIYDQMLYSFVNFDGCTFYDDPNIVSPDELSGTQLWQWARQYFLADTIAGDYRLYNVRLCDENGNLLPGGGLRPDGRKWPISRKDLWVRNPLTTPTGLTWDRNANYIDIKGSRSSVGALPSTGQATGDAYIVLGSVYVWTGAAWQSFGSQTPVGKVSVVVQLPSTAARTVYAAAPRVLDTNGSTQMSMNFPALATTTNTLFAASIHPIWWWGFRFVNNRWTGSSQFGGQHQGYVGRSPLIALHARWDKIEIRDNVVGFALNNNVQTYHAVGQWQNNAWYNWTQSGTNTTYLRSLDGNNNTYTGPDPTDGNYKSWIISGNYWINAVDNQFTPTNTVVPSAVVHNEPIRTGERYVISGTVAPSTSSGSWVNEPLAFKIINDDNFGDISDVSRNLVDKTGLIYGITRIEESLTTRQFTTNNYYKFAATSAFLQAIYPGSLSHRYAVSASTPISRTVSTQRYVTETVVRCRKPFSAPGETVGVVVTVTLKTPVVGIVGYPPPTGTVNLYAGGVLKASGALAVGTLVDGAYTPSSVTLNVSFAAGLYPLYAEFIPSTPTIVTSTSFTVYQWATTTPPEATNFVIEAAPTLAGSSQGTSIGSTIAAAPPATVSASAVLEGTGTLGTTSDPLIVNRATAVIEGVGNLVASVSGISTTVSVITFVGTSAMQVDVKGTAQIDALLDVATSNLTAEGDRIVPKSGPYSGWIVTP